MVYGGGQSFAVHFTDLKRYTKYKKFDKYNSGKLQRAFPIEYK